MVVRANRQQFICCSIDRRVSTGFGRRRLLAINDEPEESSLKSRHYVVGPGIVVIPIQFGKAEHKDISLMGTIT